MKKLICIIALFCAVSVHVDAQDLKSILSGVAKKVVGDKATTEFSLIGTWEYVGPDCQLVGGDVLKEISGETAGKEVEKKMVGIYEKAGLNTIQFTFNEDKTCSYVVKGKKVEGTYEFDSETKTVSIKSGKLKLKITAHVATLGNNMSFLFDADKVLSVVQSITGFATKITSSATSIDQMASNFTGLKIGFELKKQ